MIFVSGINGKVVNTLLVLPYTSMELNFEMLKKVPSLSRNFFLYEIIYLIQTYQITMLEILIYQNVFNRCY